MIRPIVLIILIVLALTLPIGICIVLGAGYIAGALTDVSAQGVLHHIAFALGIFWVVDLVCLLVTVAVDLLLRKSERSDKD